ncbi:serine/threonine-protein kinase [Nonomuraea maritima]|uniref:serine/threonine-protein kinase n=1 Tax=Nonomuraea maritima TaxID=683260 RepID=UPI003712527E
MNRQVGARYRLIEPIGEGGMGVVWRAYDELLDRTVAIKEVRYTGVDDARRAELNRRTIREARAAGRLDHPSVVVVHDVVEEDGRPWIVMQLVRSRSLAQVVRANGPLAIGQVAVIGDRVLDALRAAHATGVLHRDVKPENILLADDGRVVLTDFGIASMDSEAGLTATGGLVGTPAYMPPERLNGDPARPESDLWALGATLYTAVEGTPPFHSESWAATVAAVLRDDPRPPSRSGALTPVIMGLLHRNPDDRIPAEEAAHLLRDITTNSWRPGPSPRANSPVPPPAPPADAPSSWPAPLGDAPSSQPGPLADKASSRPAPLSDRPSSRPTPVGERPFAELDSAEAPTLRHPAGGDRPSADPLPFPEPNATGGPSRTGGNTSATAGRRRAKPLWVALTAVLTVVAAAAAAGVLLSGNRTSASDDPTATGTTTPTHHPTHHATRPTAGHPTATQPTVTRPTKQPASTPGPSPDTTPGATPGATVSGVPDGWRTYTNTAGRFRLALPDGWQAKKNPSRDSVNVSGPGTPGTLIVEWTVPDLPWDDPESHWVALEKEIQAKGQFQQYTRIGITPTDYLGVPAADWEFTRVRNGVLIHVVNRGFHTADGRPYAVYWETTDARWKQDRHYADTFLKTFRPL